MLSRAHVRQYKRIEEKDASAKTPWTVTSIPGRKCWCRAGHECHPVRANAIRSSVDTRADTIESTAFGPILHFRRVGSGAGLKSATDTVWFPGAKLYPRSEVGEVEDREVDNEAQCGRQVELLRNPRKRDATESGGGRFTIACATNHT